MANNICWELKHSCFQVYSYGEKPGAGSYFFVGKGDAVKGSRALGVLSSCEAEEKECSDQAKRLSDLF